MALQGKDESYPLKCEHHQGITGTFEAVQTVAIRPLSNQLWTRTLLACFNMLEGRIVELPTVVTYILPTVNPLSQPPREIIHEIIT